MEKLGILILIAGLSWETYCQTTLEKSVNVKEGQSISMDFVYPKLIRIETWDRAELWIKAAVTINNGLHDNAFKLTITDDEAINVRSEIEDYENLPKKIVIHSAGVDYFFDTDNQNDPAIQKFKNTMDSELIQYMQHGVIVEISLDIKVPKNADLQINSRFGMIEFIGEVRRLNINSKHGGLDVSIDQELMPNLIIHTRFGEVYSNLDCGFSGGNIHPTSWNDLKGDSQSNEICYDLRSEFGNIYLRKSK